ncbi:hypothetical protein [Umezawaea sp. NPDC059074]|uniref:hypothetical protein n=1 Tax=Umezawaea sp. NPDC059074 TaxID=3346716 RepID=UPI0036ACAB56
MEDSAQWQGEEVVLRLIAVASRTSTVCFLAAVWSIIAPLAFDRTVLSEKLAGFWVVVAIGGAVLVLSMVRAMAPLDAPWLSVVTAVLGIWSIGETLRSYTLADGVPIAISGIVVGSAIIAASATSAAATYRARQITAG